MTAAVWLLGAVTASAQQEEAPAPGLTIESVDVTPANPGVETLCQLRVTLRNDGELPAYQLGFDVKLGGRSIDVYEDQLWLQEIPPGDSTEVRLYNFWTTETGRERPTDGRLELEVVLREAQWLEISTESEPSASGDGEAETIEVWTAAGAVPGLPVTHSSVVEVSR